MAFWLSTFSAVTELGVTAAVYAFLHGAYYHDRFRNGLLAFALTYEVLVNIAYMTFRLFQDSHAEYPGWFSALLAGHGLLSLVMFLGLVAIFAMAAVLRRRGRNLFREQPQMTASFAVMWGLSILSGEAIYVYLYLL